MYPPAKRTPGMPYNHGYSGGSVGPATCQKGKREEMRSHTFEHVEHSFGDHETTRDVHESQQD
jgi:hypothetical protein